MRVAIIMGSTSDLPKVEPAVSILKNYGVEVDVRCLSAHRAHAGLSEFIEEANNNGTEVIIAAAGMAAALPPGRSRCVVVRRPKVGCQGFCALWSAGTLRSGFRVVLSDTLS